MINHPLKLEKQSQMIIEENKLHSTLSCILLRSTDIRSNSLQINNCFFTMAQKTENKQ